MTRKPREHGWRDPYGITHHIDTRKIFAFQKTERSASCGCDLLNAARVRSDSVDCMACIAITTRRERLPPRPPPDPFVPSWWFPDGTRHRMHANEPWQARCGVSLRSARTSNNPANCTACTGQKPKQKRREKAVYLGRRSR